MIITKGLSSNSIITQGYGFRFLLLIGIIYSNITGDAIDGDDYILSYCSRCGRLYYTVVYGEEDEKNNFLCPDCQEDE